MHVLKRTLPAALAVSLLAVTSVKGTAQEPKTIPPASMEACTRAVLEGIGDRRTACRGREGFARELDEIKDHQGRLDLMKRWLRSIRPQDMNI